MRTVISSVLIFALVLGGAGVVWASDQADIPVTLRIPQMIIMKLDATELVFKEVDFDYLLGAANLTRVGVIASKKRAVSATIRANIPYTLFVSAPEEYFLGVSGGELHISQLKWRLSDPADANMWESITLERVPVQSGQPGTMKVPFDFQLTAYWENPAQTYRGEILLTVIPDEF